jgi:hypothetical protein
MNHRPGLEPTRLFARFVSIHLVAGYDISNVNIFYASGDTDEDYYIGLKVADSPLNFCGHPDVAGPNLSHYDFPFA